MKAAIYMWGLKRGALRSAFILALSKRNDKTAGCARMMSAHAVLEPGKKIGMFK